MMNAPRGLTALAVTALLSAGWSASAEAQVCAPGMTMPAFPDPETAVFEIEGPVVEFDRTARTLKVFNATIGVPAALEIETGFGKFITFEQLTDPTLEAQRTIVGGTVKGEGEAVDTDGDGCMEFVATNIYFEFSENVLVGPLTATSYDAANGTLFVQGAPVKMNTDPRLPSVILDASSNPVLTFADLAGHEGEIVAPEGYYDATTGVLYAIALETGIFIESLATDNVVVEKARHELDEEESELRVGGFVSPTGAASVTIYAPGALNAELNACTGTVAGTVALVADAVTGTSVFDFRQRIDIEEILEEREDDGIEVEDENGVIDLSEWAIGSVCVQSSGGGATRVNVDLR